MLEELTALVQRRQHQFADNATVLLAGGDAARALRAFEWRTRLFPDPDSGGLRRPATT